MADTLDPSQVASLFRDELRAAVAAIAEPLTLVGFLASDHGPSRTYADYTEKACRDVGVRFDLRTVHRLEAEDAIAQANHDPNVHGLIVYYPIFGTEQDGYLRDWVDPSKDIEGLHSFWARCLYENRRFLDAEEKKKAILPCTPLAILKLLEAAGAFQKASGKPLAGKRVCVFNRSEVVGRPLAAMMSNDGAEVISFDADGPLLFLPRDVDGHDVRETNEDRRSALASADIVVTGVPHRSFPLIRADEIRAGIIGLNFSTMANFGEDAIAKTSIFVPRVGPMTVTMALRNTVRLYRNARS
ncbi:MAG TPA: bifunctional methylenetetrahydrofolate dehydrogenase/methenyltetrahydrofolate cyclohydrolase [Polyangiaceae bacterium]|jgi:methylenetetrahydrofolate dehydrogenase (NADP+)/methenyltetrahydrofolate cyclohydrolase